MTYPVASDLQSWLGASATDAQMTTAVDAVVAFVEEYTGRRFVAATETRYIPVRVPYVRRKRELFLFDDLVSVSSITNGDGSAVQVSQYWLEGLARVPGPPFYKIQLYQTSGITWVAGDEERVTIAGDWGYSASCPDDVFEMILRMAQAEYMARQSGAMGQQVIGSRQTGIVMSPGAIPDDIMARLNSVRRYGG